VASRGYAVRVNGQTVTAAVTEGEASYVYLTRRWRRGDVIDVTLPMQLRYETCPNLPDYVAFLYGPVLLGAATTSADTTAADYEALPNEYADDSRMGHSLAAHGRMGSLLDAPMLIGDRDTLLGRISPLDLDSLRFAIRCERDGGARSEVLTLQPFYTLHHVRYMIYWLRQTPEEWHTNPMVRQAAEDALWEQRTVDEVAPGEQQSEAGHSVRIWGRVTSHTHSGEIYRQCGVDGYLEYTLSTGLTAQRIDTATQVAPQLRLRFSTDDGGRRLLLQPLDPTTLQPTMTLEVQVPRDAAKHSSDGFTEVNLPLPWSALLTPDGRGQTQLSLRIAKSERSGCPGLYHLRMIAGE
jgi:hypothetical protein